MVTPLDAIPYVLVCIYLYCAISSGSLSSTWWLRPVSMGSTLGLCLSVIIAEIQLPSITILIYSLAILAIIVSGMCDTRKIFSVVCTFAGVMLLLSGTLHILDVRSTHVYVSILCACSIGFELCAYIVRTWFWKTLPRF